MKTRQAVIGALFVLACVLATFLPRRSPPSYTELEGRVFVALDRQPDPVAGATVSNNWDKTTTSTDAAGHFVLRVRRVAADEFVVIRAQTDDKAACQQFNGSVGHKIDLFLDGGRFGSQKCR